MLHDGASHDLPLLTHSGGRGMNVILHAAQACVSQSHCCMMLHDLPLFMHSGDRGVNVILHEAPACVSQSQCCSMERCMTCPCQCIVVAGAWMSFCIRQKLV